VCPAASPSPRSRTSWLIIVALIAVELVIAGYQILR
jgi:hypothetical protein